MTDEDYRNLDARLLADANNSGHVAGNLRALCEEIGPRFAGTEGYRRAADYMLEQFRSFQLNRPHLEPFTFNAWRRGPAARLAVVAPAEEVLPCYELVYSAATGPRGAIGEVIDLAGGLAETFEAHRHQIAERFVLITRGGRHRKEVYEQCVALGSAGLIYSVQSEGTYLCSGSVGEGTMGAIPAVSITRDAAMRIQQLTQSVPVKMHLMTDSRCEPADTWNVVGELTGRRRPEELIIVGGHLDSHEIGQGAYDNAAGAVMVMEMARLLAGQRDHLHRSVRFIGFSAEEIGLLGSHHHARAHVEELSTARLMFNCDTPAISEPWIVGAHSLSDFETYLPGLSQRMGVAMTYRQVTHQHSDHYPFTRLGIPALVLAGSRRGLKPGGFGHTAADTFDKIPAGQLRDAAALAARIVLRAANEDDWPTAASRRN